jgi:hypothetical protein
MSTANDEAADMILLSLELLPPTGRRGDERRREALRLVAELVRRDQSIEPALQLLESSWSAAANNQPLPQVRAIF